MKKRSAKIIAALLTLVLLISTFPFTTLAYDANIEKASNQQSEKITSNQSVEMVPNPDYYPTIQTTEISERREENVKHFRNSDGTAVAISYGYAVHRKDENGNWVDIDNRLSAQTDEKSSVYSTHDQRVTFSNDTSGKMKLSMQENGYRITMEMVTEGSSVAKQTTKAVLTNHETVAKQIAGITQNAKQEERLEQLGSISTQSGIRYTNVQSGIDLEYVLVSNDIKENIIVSEPQAEYLFHFALRLDGLKAELQADGSILLTDIKTGESPYIIPAPYMFDASGERSNDVVYNLKQVTNGAYLLTVEAERKWINDESRAFPIVIDPSIQKSIVYDTYIDAANPSVNYGRSTELHVSDTDISFVRATMPTLPAQCQFSKATLYVYYYYPSNITEGSLTAGAYQVLQSWEEYSLTWNSPRGISTTRLAANNCTAARKPTVDSPNRTFFDVSAAAALWYNNSSPNYGIALKRESGTNTSVILKSYEAGSQHRPFFIVTYTEPILASGLYRIKNVATGLYVDVDAGGVTQNTRIQQWSEATEYNKRNQLFKITFLTTAGTDYQWNYYSIRSMTNSQLAIETGLGSGDRGAYLGNAYYTDSWANLLYNQMWAISKSGNYYFLKNGAVSDESYLTAPTNTTDGEQLFTADTMNGNYSKWILEPYTGEEIPDSLDMYVRTSFINRGESFTYESYMYSSRIGVNGPIKYSVVNVDGTSTDKATINSLGRLEALKPGKIKVRATYNNAPWTWVLTVTIDGVNDGTYFFKNKQLGYYMQIKKPNYYTIGEIMELKAYDGGDYQKWKIEHVRNGYYKILSVKSGLAISVQAVYLNNDEKALVQEAYTGADRQLWRINQTSRGTYILRPKSGESYSTDWCMCAGASFIEAVKDGRNVEQRAYTNNSDYKDEWILEPFSNYQIQLYGVENLMHDHMSALQNLQFSLRSYGYNNVNFKYDQFSSSEILSVLHNANVFTIRCHGYAPRDENGNVITTGIILNEVASESQGIGFFGCYYDNMTDGSDCIIENESYSNLKLALFIGCETAAGGDTNLPASIVRQGATTAVGFTEGIQCNAANSWLELLYDQLLSGETITSAVKYANDNSPADAGFDNKKKNVLIYGDEYYTFGR